MLKSLRIRNLRSFPNREDSPYIDIKPITILVGKNSSGKSTFARTFPLLRQSVETKKTGPILWYGSYVDFGAFNQALSKKSEQEIIYFDFKIETSIASYQQIFRNRFISSGFHYIVDIEDEEQFFEINVELGVREENNKTVAHSVKFSIEDIEFSIIFEKNQQCSLKINNKEIDFEKPLQYINFNKTLPDIVGIHQSEKTINGKRQEIRRIIDTYIEEHFTKIIYDKISSYFHGKTDKSTITDGVLSLPVCQKADLSKILNKKFKGNKHFIKQGDHVIRYLSDSIYIDVIAKNFKRIYDTINTQISDIFLGVRYIAPLRASAERYYRYQDLQVDEINHTGSNLAMLLRSLSKQQTIQFSTWTQDNFGFSVRVEEQGLHCALMIKNNDIDNEYNINDMGFGFSQLLPIIVSIWLEIRSGNKGLHNKTSKKLIFSIEQPELHLHPEYQSKVAIMFSKVVDFSKRNGLNIRIIVETHSKTIINTLGDSIEKGIISNEDVNVAIFEREDSETIVTFSSYSKEGYLTNWPVGFFSG